MTWDQCFLNSRLTYSSCREVYTHPQDCCLKIWCFWLNFYEIKTNRISLTTWPIFTLSKSTIETLEREVWNNFEQISHILLVFFLVDFQYVFVCREIIESLNCILHLWLNLMKSPYCVSDAIIPVYVIKMYSLIQKVIAVYPGRHFFVQSQQWKHLNS